MNDFVVKSLLLSLLVSGMGYAQDADVVEELNQVRAQEVNPTGVWVWERGFGGRTRTNQVTLSYEDGVLVGVQESPQRGNRPSRFGGPVPLTDIKVEGDRITFDVTRKFGDNEFTTKYAGVIVGDEIAGMTSNSFGGRLRESAWMAQRKIEEAVAVSATSGDEVAAASEGNNRDGGQASSAENNLVVARPMRVPDPGEQTDAPYVPRPILPGGIVLPLYKPDSPHLNQDRIKEPETYNLSNRVHGRINSIVNIHNPSIEVHFASPSMNTGSVVILAAGGGHRTLNVGGEGADFVPFFYNYGVNTVILRNRLRSDDYEPSTDGVRDAMQAVRLVRKHATAWNLDPARIGIMGFSAGAELAAPAAIQFEQFDAENADPTDSLAGVSSRPDFVGIIYPGPTPFTREPETAIPKNSPPAFITCAGAGDRIHAIWATDYFSAMLRAGIPNVEMHIYGNGYHPGDRGATGGLTHRAGIPFGTWHERFIEWFDDVGFLGEAGVETKAAKDSQEFVNQPPRSRRGRGRRGAGRGPRPSRSD